jgi:multidrug resistance efflux pump
MSLETANPEPLPAEMRPKLPTAPPGAKMNRLPAAAKRRRRGLVVLALLIVAAGVAVAGAAAFARTQGAVRTDLVTHRVKRDRLELTVIERGTLESADNRDVYCRVKSGAKNSTVATTIKSVIDDGSRVNKDQLLVELDESGLVEQLRTEKINLDSAESAKVQAEEQYKITVSQNESDIKSAEVTLELARIDLQKYLEGDFPQALKDVNGRIKTAESDLEQQRDRAAWAQRMVKKGYQTVSQAQAEQSKQESLEIALAKVVEEKRVLTDPEYGLKKRSETDYRNKVAEAERALARVKSQALAKEVQAKTDRETKRSLWEQQVAKVKDIEEEIKKCKIYAPQDGMVVYFVPEQARFGGGSQQSIVAQGEPVREGQKLMQIPDLRHMLVNTKVHEAMVSRVKAGQPAVVRIDAFTDRTFAGHIDSVATISTQQDFWAPDVKVYTTKVALDGEVDGLKPGMSAEVKITVGDPLEQVLTVPVEAIVGSAEMGGHRTCFVMTPAGPEPREIGVGISNERVAEVREGLSEGDVVVLNPRAIVGDKVKTRQPGSNTTGDQKEGDGGGRNGRKGNGGPGKGEQSPGAPPAGERPGAAAGGSAGPGTSAGAGAPGGPGGPAGAASPEERQKMRQQMMDRFKKASPEERKQMLENIPEQFRERFKEGLKAQGIEVP